MTYIDIHDHVTTYIHTCPACTLQLTHQAPDCPIPRSNGLLASHKQTTAQQMCRVKRRKHRMNYFDCFTNTPKLLQHQNLQQTFLFFVPTHGFVGTQLAPNAGRQSKHVIAPWMKWKSSCNTQKQTNTTVRTQQHRTTPQTNYPYPIRMQTP